MDNEVKNEISVMAAKSKMEYLAVSLTKHIQNMHAGNSTNEKNQMKSNKQKDKPPHS